MLYSGRIFPHCRLRWYTRLVLAFSCFYLSRQTQHRLYRKANSFEDYRSRQRAVRGPSICLGAPNIKTQHRPGEGFYPIQLYGIALLILHLSHFDQGGPLHDRKPPAHLRVAVSAREDESPGGPEHLRSWRAHQSIPVALEHDLDVVVTRCLLHSRWDQLVRQPSDIL